MQTVPHDLGFILCPNTPCGLPACSRNSPHFHCRFCTYGTSQIANAIAHGRLCSELPQKDYAEALYSTTQPFSYYPPVSTSSSTSKLITQQSTMLSFVLPSQNQFGGLYGPQTVFPNPNLFSPSGFNSFGQMDASWMTQSRMMSNTQSAASTDQGCCPLGAGSPDKMPTKELNSQNWPQPGASSNQKYLDQSASCSISLLFLEHNKDTEECIDVDDICLTPKGKESSDNLEEKKSDCLVEEKPFISISTKGEGLVDVVDSIESAGTFLAQEPSTNVTTNEAENVGILMSVKSQVDVKDMTEFDQQPHSHSSNETDIVVEDSGSDSEREPDPLLISCAVCETKPTINAFTPMSAKNPLTSSSRTPIYEKLHALLHKYVEETSICSRCFNLINQIDSLEMKLSVFTAEIKDIYNVGKENVSVQLPELMEASMLTACTENGESYNFCCEYCGLIGFASDTQLEAHTKLHNRGPEFQCELCGDQFLDKTLLSVHIAKHKMLKNNAQYQCTTCDVKFQHQHTLKYHIESHENGNFMCQHCGMRIKHASNLRVHVRRCTGHLNHACEKCNKKFPLKSLLEKHISMDHNLTFRHHCKQCQKGFWKRSELHTHLISHQKDKPFQCDDCGNTYKSKKNLNHHLKIHQTDLCCRFCGKNFTRSETLADHLNSHTGRQPYKCDKCEKRFGNRINYNCHMKLHLSEGVGVKCILCKQTVTGSLRDHMKSHKDAPSFRCKICSSVFAFKNSMVKHLRKKHALPPPVR